MTSRNTGRIVAVFVIQAVFFTLAASFSPTLRADDLQVNLSFTVVAAAAGPDRIVLTGDGKFNSNQVVANGTFLHFLDGGTPPLAIVGAGTWKARRLTSFTQTGTYGPGISGILLMEVDLVPSAGGGIVPATMQVVCNIPPGGLFTGSPEGVTLEILASGATFNPLAGNTFFSAGVEARR